MWFVGQILINLGTSSIWGLLKLPLGVLLGVTYASMLVTTQWPLKRAPHLTSLAGFVLYGGLETHWSYLRYGNECIIVFFARCFMSWTRNSGKDNYRSLFSLLSLCTVFSDLALWRHHSWSETSRERRALTLWRHIRRLFLQAHIGARRSSLVDNNREYRILTTRYSRLSVLEA